MEREKDKLLLEVEEHENKIKYLENRYFRD